MLETLFVILATVYILLIKINYAQPLLTYFHIDAISRVQFCISKLCPFLSTRFFLCVAITLFSHDFISKLFFHSCIWQDGAHSYKNMKTSQC